VTTVVPQRRTPARSIAVQSASVFTQRLNRQ